jgi:hypothetical protein
MDGTPIDIQCNQIGPILRTMRLSHFVAKDFSALLVLWSLLTHDTHARGFFIPFPKQSLGKSKGKMNGMSINASRGEGEYMNDFSLITPYRLFILVGVFSFCVYKYVLKTARYRVGLRMLVPLSEKALICSDRKKPNLEHEMAARRQHSCSPTNGHLHSMLSNEVFELDVKRGCFLCSQIISKY